MRAKFSSYMPLRPEPTARRVTFFRMGAQVVVILFLNRIPVTLMDTARLEIR